MSSNIADFRSLFLTDVAMLDVRAPVEFQKGAFPRAVNLPLMNDDERHRIGICYKRQGHDAAVAMGHRLVSGDIRQQRINAWLDFARANPSGCLYCFRGGERSSIAQRWLREAGIDYPRVAGGYKAMRAFLIDTLESAASDCDFVTLGGLTGSGKTEVLSQVSNAVDLEAHANHRGSSFGRRVSPQPVQIDFENGLAIEFLRKRQGGMDRFVLEDESRFIGSCSVPLALHQRMQAAPLVWLEEPLAQRAARIERDYVTGLFHELRASLDDDAAWQAVGERLHQSLARIAKRLGMERYQAASALLRDALAWQQRTGDPEPHRKWITLLLTDYYDPMYASQRQSRSARIVFRGGRDEVLDWFGA